MHPRKANLSGTLLLLLSLLPLLPLTTSTQNPSLSLSARNYGPPRNEVPPEAPLKADGPVPTKNPSPGTKDAPVDGQDGKPHNGPNIPSDGPPTVGAHKEVGVSAGVPSVDMTKPPPVTGEHEIVDLEGKEGVGQDIKSDLDPESNLSKSVTTKPSGDTPTTDSDAKPVSPEGEDIIPKKKPPTTTDESDELRGPPVKLIESISGPDDSTESGMIVSPGHSFLLSFVMIIFSEIGDKTFLIAALMAMKHSRLLVFTAALCSLIIMSILSALLGHTVPTLIPKRFTSFLAAGLFLVFGVRMLSEGLRMEKGTGGVKEEMKEVEQELQEKEAAIKRGGARDLEEGGGGLMRGKSSSYLHRATASPSLSDSDDDTFKPKRKGRAGSSRGGKRGLVGDVRGMFEGIQNLAGLVFSPAWVQTFVMTFLGEWGDRSQIATIAMAAGQDYWWVTIGTIVGHSLCTAGAVVGGKFLAERISVRNVTLGGAGAFLVFAVLYFAEALYL